MKYKAGNRFTPETYLKTEAESGTSVSLKVTGELEGVEVSFDSGDVPELTTLSATENITYEAPEGTAYNEVTVNVPNSYTAEDAGKVVVEGALVAQTSTTKTANGTYNTTTNNEVVIEVPNTYTAADEGKVVSSGALVAQTSTTKTANGTYDTTLNNEVVVNVPASGSSYTLITSQDITVTQPASSTAEVVTTLNVPGIYSEDLFFIEIKKKTAPARGEFYYSGNYIPNNLAANGSTSAFTQIPKFILSHSNIAEQWVFSFAGYGVYISSISSSDGVEISARTSSDIITVSGDYTVNIYKLKLPNGDSSPYYQL